MNAEWIKSATARRIVAHWSDTRPAWLWDQDGTRLLWRNAAARYYLGKLKKSGPKPGAEPVPIRGQIARLIRLGSRGRASLSRIQLLAADRPISMTALCTPLELPEHGAVLLIVGVDPIDPELLDQAPLTQDDPLETGLLPPGADWLVINEDSQITGGSAKAIARYAEEIESEGLPQAAPDSDRVQLGGEALVLTRFAASPHEAMLLLFQPQDAPPQADIAAIRDDEGMNPQAHRTDAVRPEAIDIDPPQDRPGEDESVVPVAGADRPDTAGDSAAETGSLASLFDRLADDEGLYGALSEADERFTGPEPVTPETIIGAETQMPSPPEPVAIEDPGEIDGEEGVQDPDVAGVPDAEGAPAFTEDDLHADPIGSLIADADAEAWAELQADAEDFAEAFDADPAPQPALPESAAESEPAAEPEPAAPTESVATTDNAPETPAPVVDAVDEAEPDAIAADPAPVVWRVIGRGFTAADTGTDTSAADAAEGAETAMPAEPETFDDPAALADLVALDAPPSDSDSDSDPEPEAPDDAADLLASDLADESTAEAPGEDAAADEPADDARGEAEPPSGDDADDPLDAETVERVSRYNFDELTRILTDRVAAPATDASAVTENSPGLVNLAGETFILNRLPLGILVFRDQQVLFANRALTELTGHPSIESLRQAGLASVFPGDDSTEAGPVTHLLRSDGELMPVSARLQSISWHGRPALMLSASPLENRIGHEGAVRTFSELSAEVREDGYITADRHGLVTLVSLHGRIMLGEPEEDLVGRPLAALVPPDALDELRSFLELPARFAETSRPAVTLPSLVRGVELQLFAEGQAGIVAGYFGFVHRRQRIEPAPAPQPAPATTPSDDIEPSMLVRISRGVRRPLNTVIGFSDMIRTSGAADTQRTLEYVRDIQSAGEEIAALVDELDDFARLREGRYDLKSDETDLGELLTSCLHRVRGQAAAARVLVRSAVSERLPHIVVDRPSMTQAMLNLLASAIDQTPAGGTVILSAQLEDDGAVVINVRDNGQRRTDLGERFVVFRDGVGREGEVLAPMRSSVGLALTRSLLAVNALSLSVDPAVGSGTLFSLVVPANLVRS